ncbi:MAG TPA: dTDP-4-dehydrorhamnose 3,5-epimerase [Erysipelotrichaceae bacterium]|nr:dTDP-4-dehydrorhamnose 3,5-epimerase [Erysipelotrichaceae bacterium]
MRIEKTKLNDLIIIVPDVYGDNRGWFTESYNKQKYQALGIDVDFVQDNHSYSKEVGTLRGLHFQIGEFAQTKLVRCVRGRLMDVCVDLRKNSPTYLQWDAIELTETNKLQLLVPKGFAHGFVTLSEDVEIMYKVDTFYSKDHDSGVKYDDSDIGVDWDSFLPNVEFILSDKDKQLKPFKELNLDF